MSISFSKPTLLCAILPNEIGNPIIYNICSNQQSENYKYTVKEKFGISKPYKKNCL